MRIRQKLPSALAVVIVISMIVACASEPTIQTGPEAEISFDGLHRVDNSVFRFVWVEPEIDLARYSKILRARLNSVTAPSEQQGSVLPRMNSRFLTKIVRGLSR